MKKETAKREKYRKGSFGIASDILTKSLQRTFWGYIKNHYSVRSRSSLSEKQWAEIFEQLRLAQENKKEYFRLVHLIGSFKRNQDPMDTDNIREFEKNGISRDVVLCWSLAHCRKNPLDGRKTIVDVDWKHINNLEVNDELIETIKKQSGCRVYQVIPNGTPEETKKKVFEGLFEFNIIDRALRFAEKSKHDLEIHAYGHVLLVSSSYIQNQMPM